MSIDWRDVQSSMIARVGHDPDLNQLHVEFKRPGSRAHMHDNVTADEFEELCCAGSVGQHYLQNIRDRG